MRDRVTQEQKRHITPSTHRNREEVLAVVRGQRCASCGATITAPRGRHVCAQCAGHTEPVPVSTIGPNQREAVPAGEPCPNCGGLTLSKYGRSVCADCGHTGGTL